MPRRSLRAAAVVGAALAFSITLSGCASATPTISLDDDTVVVDVRTPAEDDGHLEGAINIDFQSPAFETTVSELDTSGEYVVYCASGNRSAQAVAVMEAAGLEVTDAGGISAAEQAMGLPIIP